MPALDVEDFYDSDSSDNEDKHSKLLSSVSQLDSTQRVKPAQRKEIASEVSEFNLTEGVSGKNKLINVKELVQAIGKKSGHQVISKKFKNVSEKSKTLPKPLEKPTEERLKRAVGFENVKNQLRRWDAIVTRNALKDQMQFPLNDNSMKMQESKEFLSQCKSATPLEQELAKVLKEDIKEKEQEDNEFPLTLEEMLEKRKEMAQMRARLSYKQSKAKWQSKIKSKKYHRLLKQEKLKQQLKEFEVLQKTDPEAALKKLSELDKTRAQERASLRHRNTGQWAKNLTVKAKYDVETRKILAEQLKISRELTQKVSQMDSSDDDDEEPAAATENSLSIPPPATISPDNPWTVNVSDEVKDFISGYKKFWSENGQEINPTQPNTSDNSTNNKIVENSKKTVSESTSLETDKSKPKKNSVNASSTNDLKTVSKPDKLQNTTNGFSISENESSNQEFLKNANDKPAKTKNNKKITKKNKKLKENDTQIKTSVSVYPTSGVWIITSVNDDETPKNKKQDVDIDTLFDDLNDQLAKKATEKAATLQNELKRQQESTHKEAKKKKFSDEFDLSLKQTKGVERPELDGLLEGGIEDGVLEGKPVSNTLSVENKSESTPAIDPKNFIQIKPKRLRTFLPEEITGEEEEVLDDDTAQQKIIEEAFAEDDVIGEFNEMKKNEEKSSKVEIQTSLPGWGKWGGTGIKQKRKKRCLVMNLPPRKDKAKKDMIITENENPNLKTHLVKDVPHPFKSVEAFEANIRAPVGRTWVPETAHQKLIEKQVVTKLGTVIEPMDESEIVQLKKTPKSPYQGKKKEKNK